jgi:hypothetical protein
LRWLLLLEEKGVTLKYLPRKNVSTVAYALSHLDKNKKESLTLLSG